MKSILIAAAATIGLAGAALAGGPALLTDDQMDQVVAGGTHVIDSAAGPNTLTAGGWGSSSGGTGGISATSDTTLPTTAGGYGTSGGGDGCGGLGSNSC